ncbi:MAG TPA: ABC transporter transmembrane domain-containing protein, partial [Bacillota bacterium]|nr:ABC transporter transmembrane domain-containing protein [Bacillota bacterium]
APVAPRLPRPIAKIDKLPMKYFDGTTHGEVLSRVTNDVDTVSQTLNQSMSQIVTSITTLIGVLIMMISISWTMTLASAVIMPFSGLFMAMIVKQSQKYFKKQQEYLGHINGKVEEVYGGHRIMKAFNAEQRTNDEFGTLNKELYGSAWKSQFLSGMMFPIISFIGNIGYVLIAILGGWLAVKKSIQVGDILAFVQYVRSFTQPIAQSAQIANVLQSTAAAAERVFEFIDEKEEEPDVKEPASTADIKGEVVFDHVHFGYDADKPVIGDFSAFIRPGQRVAIVGPTGAGKTTIVKLLMRFYELQGGRILIDGTDTRQFRRDELRNVFGMVLQDTWLFNGTIMEN